MILYDNFEDVRAKLLNTMCYYKGKAIFIKDIQHDAEDPNDFILVYVTVDNRNRKHVKLSDPGLNYLNFNLGYVTYNGVGAVWWYRIPQRQYRQGLKRDQLGIVSPNARGLQGLEFNFDRNVVNMLENKYPKFGEVAEQVRDFNDRSVAFHRDFATSWDRIHRDYIIEYKGRPIGSATDTQNFKLIDEYQHLTEAFKEAVA